MLCCSARVSSHRLSRGILPRESHGALTNAADVLIKAPILVDDSAGLSALEVKSRARRMKARHDIGLIVVDYLQLMNYPMYAKDRQREIAAISGVMKAMAKELKLPVIVLSQFSRAPEGRHGSVPKLSDLRDSGAIEQDADVVLLLRRPIRAPDDPEHNPEDPKLSVVDIAKHRNGPTGLARLNFEEDYTRFEDRQNRPMAEDEPFDIPEAGDL
jgi:replicative DNA helicase